MKKTTFLLLILCGAVSQTVSAQIFGDLGSNRIATSSFQFLKIGVGAREVALAETGITISDDANSLFWNPGHIALMTGVSSSFSYNHWYADINQTTLALVYPAGDIGTFGFSVNYLTTGAMERRTTLQPFGTGEKFNYYDGAFGLTYARQMTQQFTFGITAKYITEHLAEVEFSAVALDLGMTYILDEKDTRLSIALMNFGGRHKPSGEATPPDMEAVSSYQEYQTPSNFRLGMSKVFFRNEDHQILAAVQLNHPNDGAENYSAGVEYGFMDLLYLRSGLKLNVDGQDVPSFGFGLKKALLSFDTRFDYAASYISPLGFAHRLTLGLTIPEGDLR
ncbi:MAG: PorV/PorQ family protein [Bacteroidetes bacterium]|nr:PorV/PorQ family protein [Bacteroidota bacterium]